MREKSKKSPFFRNESSNAGLVPKFDMEMGQKTKSEKKMVVPPGFEPRSGGPEPPMLGHYTTGLSV